MEEELTEILNQPRNTLLLLPWVKSLLCCVYMGHGGRKSWSPHYPLLHKPAGWPQRLQGADTMTAGVLELWRGLAQI